MLSRHLSLTDKSLFAALFALVFSLVLGYLIATTPPPPRITIRWEPDVSSAQRDTLEATYQLTQAVVEVDTNGDEGRVVETWSYMILDTSTANVQQLVRDPSVEDTGNIDRETFHVVGASSPLRYVLYPGLFGLLIAGLSAPFGLGRRSRVGSMVSRGVPEISAEAFGLFRVFFGGALFAQLSRQHLTIDDYFQADDQAFTWWWVDWLVARPDVVVRLEYGLLVLLALFTIGLLTRLVYGLFAAGLTVWVAVMLQQETNIHSWELSFLTVLCLLPVPWGEAFSVDEMVRRWRGNGRREGVVGKRYGFAVWIPGFIFGAVWLSAAYAKLDASGLEWILGGAVKYHWVIDSPIAPVDWGLWVASHHAVAVAMSFAGVALEAVFIVTAFIHSTRVRTALACLIGLPLLMGFYLFHGVLWWTWWLAFLSFVIPWHAVFTALAARIHAQTILIDISIQRNRRLVRFWKGLDWFNRIRFVETTDDASSEPQSTNTMRPVDLLRSIPMLWPLFAVLWAAEHLPPVVRSSATRPERPARGVVTPLAVAHGSDPSPTLRPSYGLAVCLVSTLVLADLPEGFGLFASYSGSYASIADFDKRNPVKPIDRWWLSYGTRRARMIVEDDSVDRLENAIQRLTQGESLPPDSIAALRLVPVRMRSQHGELDARATLVRTPRTFDWQGGRYITGTPAVVGAVDLRSMSLVTESAP